MSSTSRAAVESLASPATRGDASITPNSKAILELKAEVQNILQKIDDMEGEADEHRLVLAALQPLPPTRKCWRRVGALLVEGDVASTIPVIQTNLGELEKLLERLRENYGQKSRELDQLMRHHV